ncbi:MAG: hypothetical protein KBE04_11675 [Phycisphaerae bacterium]|nr:hypothetical protein [Phycisphaerae bacterium]
MRPRIKNIIRRAEQVVARRMLSDGRLRVALGRYHRTHIMPKDELQRLYIELELAHARYDDACRQASPHDDPEYQKAEDDYVAAFYEFEEAKVLAGVQAVAAGLAILPPIMTPEEWERKFCKMVDQSQCGRPSA